MSTFALALSSSRSLSHAHAHERSQTRSPVVWHVVLVAFAALGGACASSADSTTSSDPAKTSSASVADSPTNAPTHAMSVLQAGGTYAFALDESDPATYFRDACAKSTPNDPGGCYAKIRAQGAREKIRLAPDGAGHVVFTSFGPDEGVETIWIEVPLTLAADGAHAAFGTPAGAAKGAWATDPKPMNARMRFEVIDATTIAMIDGKKGRLVFHKE